MLESSLATVDGQAMKPGAAQLCSVCVAQYGSSFVISPMPIPRLSCIICSFAVSGGAGMARPTCGGCS